MGLHNRKLMEPDHASPLIDETLEKICEHSCDPSSNYTFCIAPCSAICPSICYSVDPASLDPAPTSSASHSSSHPNKLFIASFSLFGITLIALFCYAFYYWRFRRSRRRRPQVAETTRDEFLDEDHGPVIDHPIWYINTVGLPVAVIESIAVFKYRKGDGLVDGTDCSVCLSEFQEDETLRLLPKCSHAFHISCIDKWLRSHTNCPMCRAPVAAARPSEPGESSGNTETRVDIPQVDEQEYGQSPGVENGGAERRAASLDSSEVSKMGQVAVLGWGSSEESNSEAKMVGRSQSLLRFVGSSLQSGPVFLKRSVSCYGDFSLATTYESSSSPS